MKIIGVLFLSRAPGFLLPIGRYLLICFFGAVVLPIHIVARPLGIDVSHYQGSIDWAAVKASGVAFAWTKATEGTG